jgi:adenylate kinase
MDQGALVPDHLVIEMLVQRIQRDDAKAGMILDGFPRNLAQAQALDDALEREAGKAIDLAVNFAVADDELIRRLSGRWLCRKCGAIYHEVGNPPRVAGRCDRCGGELYQRDDDKAETVAARLKSQKPPADLLEFYRSSGKLVQVDGLQSVEQVTADIVSVVRKKRAGQAVK